MQKLTLGCFILASLVLAAPGRAASIAKVDEWQRFEALVGNDRSYTDPFRDVTLHVTYVRPDGSTIQAWGFYDGDRTWRMRCLPDQPGQWRYIASFSDGSPGQTGVFECVKSDLPGRVVVQPDNPVWFGYSNGGAALLRGLHVGDRFFARNWDDPQEDADGNPRAAFLDWAQAQGYNLLSVASHYLNRASPGRGAAWQTPRLWPLDPEEYRGLELMLDDLARRRMLVYPFAGFFGRDSNFPRDPAGQTLYIRYVLARLSSYPNVLLNVAGPEPRLRNGPFLDYDEVCRLGAEIQRWNVFGQLLTVHNRTGDDEFRNEPWLTYGTLQGPKTFDRAKLRDGIAAARHPGKPVLAQETLWSGNSVHIRANKGADYSDDDLRKNAFAIHFSAAALVFADNDGNSSSGFTGSLDLKDRRQARHDIIKRVWDVCATLPWGRLAPRSDLAQASGAAAVCCLAAPGREYLVYIDRSESVHVRVENGPFTVEWIDARDPSRREAAGVTKDGRDLEPPAGGDDWVLWLKRVAVGATTNTAQSRQIYFPPPGESLEHQSRRTPAEVDLAPEVLRALEQSLAGGHLEPGRGKHADHG